jgi:hypothetical protein
VIVDAVGDQPPMHPKGFAPDLVTADDRRISRQLEADLRGRDASTHANPPAAGRTRNGDIEEPASADSPKVAGLTSWGWLAWQVQPERGALP